MLANNNDNANRSSTNTKYTIHIIVINVSIVIYRSFICEYINQFIKTYLDRQAMCDKVD